MAIAQVAAAVRGPDAGRPHGRALPAVHAARRAGQARGEQAARDAAEGGPVLLLALPAAAEPRDDRG